MIKRTAGRTAALALAILLPVLLGAAKCEEGSQHPSAPRVPEVPRQPAVPATGRATVPDPHAGDPQPSNVKERTITIRFRVGTKEQLPATVYISTVGGWVKPDHVADPVADTHTVTYTLTFDANAPVNLSIAASLTMSKGGNASWCSIEAGTYGNDGPRFTAGQTNVTCHLLIKRPQ